MNQNEFLLAVKDEIINSFKGVDKKYFDFNLPFFLDPIGKGIRTLYCYYFSKMLGIDWNNSIKIASTAEIVHLASLLHDDCIDNASSRRGSKTLNSMFGISTAILVGDMIVSFAFEKAKSISSEICFSLVECVKRMSEGALFEERLKYKIITEDDYIHLAVLKTSQIFRWMSVSCIFIANKNNYIESEKISRDFGVSFQIIDDIIDIEGDLNSTGKDTFLDLFEGKITYPIIIAMSDKKLIDEINEYFSTKNPIKLNQIRRYIIDNGITQKARQKAISLIENIKDDIISLGNIDSAIEFYNYIYSLTQRRR
ncbi:MAG: polyprenyl synthetase family protein [Elusimicrobiales bacterium]|nr:polyprenyl synthetase family protein [Elusimicrobiales bacterium]